MRRDSEGTPAHIIASIENSTGRKRPEERLRATYDSTYEYIGLLARDGTLLDANRASLEFAGSRREDVVGRPFWETVWFTNTPGAPEMLRESISRAATGEFIRYEATLRRTVHTEASPDLSESLAEALSVLKNRIDQAGAVIHSPEHLPRVRGDAAQIAHVLQNVLSNAIKYRKPDLRPEIHIRATLKDAPPSFSLCPDRNIHENDPELDFGQTFHRIG